MIDDYEQGWQAHLEYTQDLKQLMNAVPHTGRGLTITAIIMLVIVGAAAALTSNTVGEHYFVEIAVFLLGVAAAGEFVHRREEKTYSDMLNEFEEKWDA